MKSVKPLLPLFGLLLGIIFLVQANIAWLNPRPGFEPLSKLNEKIPFLWQYNTDSPTELFTADEFPHSLKETNVRVSRPAYPLLVRALQQTLELLTHMFSPFSTVLAYILLKFFVFMAYCCLFWKLLRLFLSERATLLALILSLFHPLAITFIGTYHTTELQFITPVIVVALLWDISKVYTPKKNILYSLLVGFLMLAKPDYAVYIAVLLFAVFKRKYKAAGLSFISYLIPLAAWLLFLKLYGVPYYDNQAAEYGQGVWLYQDFILRSPREMLQLVGDSLKAFARQAVEFYGIWLPLGAAGFIRYFFKKSTPKIPMVFIALLVLLTWFQMFASRHDVPYMAADFSFFIFGLAAYFIFEIFPFRSRPAQVMLTSVIAALTLSFHVFAIVQTPWIHPYDQHVYVEEELAAIKSYLAQRPGTSIEFYPRQKSKRRALIQNYIADATILHDLSEVPVSMHEGCRVYRFEGLYAILEGFLSLKEPEKIQSLYFSNSGVEWHPIPVRKELTVDYTMYRLAPHTMPLDPAVVSNSWGGQSYLIYVDQPRVVGETSTFAYAQDYDVVLTENGVPLSRQPPPGNVSAIIAEGKGQYSLRDDGLLVFSTSDNSDPRTNGRHYQVSYTPYSNFAEPFTSREYFLKFCPKTADDFSFVSSTRVQTRFQYNRAIWTQLGIMAKTMPQIVLNAL